MNEQDQSFVQTVVGFEKGFSNSCSVRLPYVLAKLSCGHVESVVLKPARVKCMDCGAERDYEPPYPIRCEGCSKSVFLHIWTPDRHKEEDYVTKIGDSIDCTTCKAEQKQIDWLNALDLSIVSHVRYRGPLSGFCFYRRDETSPSGFFLIGQVMKSPKIEAIIDKLPIPFPLSPEEYERSRG